MGKGRASRGEYWYFYLFSLLVNFAMTLLVAITSHSPLVKLVTEVISLAIIIPGITVLVRRLHDTNRSAWNLLWALLPIVGWIIMLVYLVQPGTADANNYDQSERS